METTISATATREIRAELGRQRLTQRELARRLGWTENKMWRRLAGHMPLSLEDVDAIAAALGVSPMDLVTPARTSS